MTFTEVLELVVRAFELTGVVILVVGSSASVVRWAQETRAGGRIHAYQRFRSNIGRTILLGLEVLIVADIVQTVAIEPTIESAVTLGIIVLVRTFLSFSLEIELEGVVPWHRRAAEVGPGASSDPAG